MSKTHWILLGIVIVLISLVILTIIDRERLFSINYKCAMALENEKHRLDIIMSQSAKVIQLNYERDAIIKPLLTKSHELNKKYSQSVDTSLIGDLDSLIREFTKSTDGI